MKKSEKPVFVDSLSASLSSAKSVVLINYSGMDVKAQQELKRRLRAVGAKMIVVKNTLLKRAGSAAKLDAAALTDEVLTGQNAIVVNTEDPVSSIQVLGKFAKEFTSAEGNPVPSFKVGIVEGSFQEASELQKLSTLPGKDALLGQLLGVLMGSEYGLVGTLNGNLQKLVYVLDQKSKS